MMMSISKVFAGCVLAAAAGQVAAQEVLIRSNAVVPVVMESDLSFKESRSGDRFFARVRDPRDFPEGTRLEGRIVSMQRQRGSQPAAMDLEFVAALLPDGGSAPISAVPIALDSKYLSRTRDGRIVAKKGALRKDQYVWGGVIGGAVLGSIIGRKTFEGAVVGALAGIIVAESQAKQEDMALRRGTEIGALFDREARISYDDREARRNGDPDYRQDRRSDTYRTDGYREPEPIDIEFAGRRLRFSGDQQPYRMGDTVMVPLERTASQIGADVEFSSKTILIEDEDCILKLEQDSDSYRLNGKRGTLSRSVAKRGGVVYVPLEVLAQLKSEAMLVNGERIGSGR